ncbi:MAG: DNA-binding domain-containing protein [Spirochaetales bacterium]|nr:DNA-binding domain-containing protein [Spirochaetales bacterium]
MISVKTVANNTGHGKTGFCFLSTSDTDAGVEEIIKEMVGYNSTLTEADTRAALSVLEAVVERLLQEGCKVRLPWVDLQLAAHGTAESISAKFQNKRGDNRFVLKALVNKKFEAKAAEKVSYKTKSSVAEMDPKIFYVLSITKDAAYSSERVVKPGMCFRIRGKNLGFDFEDEKQGVFLALKGDRKKTVRITSFIRRTQRTIDAILPQGMEKGVYAVSFVKKNGEGSYPVENTTDEIEVIE